MAALDKIDLIFLELKYANKTGNVIVNTLAKEGGRKFVTRLDAACGILLEIAQRKKKSRRKGIREITRPLKREKN